MEYFQQINLCGLNFLNNFEDHELRISNSLVACCIPAQNDLIALLRLMP